MGTMSAAYMRTYRARLAMSKAEGGLLPFQRRFAEAICRDKNPPAICALSTPRAQGKSWICGRLIARSLSPDDELFEAGTENILVSSSTSQARIVLEFSRLSLGDSADYRWSMDSCVHKASRTRVRVISSDSRRALGLGAAWTWAGVAVGLRRLRSGHLAGSKHGRLRLVCRRWPTRNVRIKCLRAHISSWFGRAAWLSTRGAPSLMLNDCCLVSGRGRLGVSSAIHIARLS